MASRTTVEQFAALNALIFAVGGPAGCRRNGRPPPKGTVASGGKTPATPRQPLRAGIAGGLAAGLRNNPTNRDILGLSSERSPLNRCAGAGTRKITPLIKWVGVSRYESVTPSYPAQVVAARDGVLPKRLANTAPAAMATPKATAGWRLLSSVKRKADSPQSLAEQRLHCAVRALGEKPPSPTTDPGVTKARRSRPLASS